MLILILSKDLLTAALGFLLVDDHAGHSRVWSKIVSALNIKINITRPPISIFQIFLVSVRSVDVGVDVRRFAVELLKIERLLQQYRIA